MPEVSVVWFTDDACLDVDVAGGKGASLAAMTTAGFPVPPGFLVPSSVLEAAVDTVALRAAAEAGDHRHAQALVLDAAPPSEALTAAYEELGSGKVAVRSSARGEDSDAASFAGQQETYLDVEGAGEVCRRVVDCWASYFSERALFYRRQKGGLGELGIAVVVQRMVAPRKAGVGFTADPVQRRRDQMVVEAVFGLGEQIVSGESTPDHYVLARDGRLKENRLANGGVLQSNELELLADLGRRLEEHFGRPQDFEWAIADDDLYLLQSRPVTTL